MLTRGMALWMALALLGCDGGPGTVQGGEYLTEVTAMEGGEGELNVTLVYGIAFPQLALRKGQPLVLSLPSGQISDVIYHELEAEAPAIGGPGIHLVYQVDRLEVHAGGPEAVQRVRALVKEGDRITIRRQ